MAVQISDSTKVRTAKWGPNKLFGDDVDQRKVLADPDAVVLFDRVWARTLQSAVSGAETCSAEEARRRLTPMQQKFFDSSQQHRSFRMQELNLECIVQLAPQGDENFELTQLWRVSSSDTHPKTLWVTFDTVEEREQFRLLASNLGFSDQDLGLQLVRDFLTKHQRRS